MGEFRALQNAILRRLADGNDHNLFAYPFIEAHERGWLAIKMMIATAWLRVRKKIEVRHDGDAVWMRITPAGRDALSETGGADG